MKKYFLFLLLFPLLCFSASELTPKGEKIPLVLSENGRTDYTIIYAENAKSAALLLRANLKSICKGIDFSLASENDAVKPPFISVGQTKLASAAGIGKSLPNRSSIEIKVVDKNLFLYANKDPFHAVVNFLEEDLGCRFYTDKIIYRPALEELKIQIVNRCETAAFEDRLVFTNPDLNQNSYWTMYNKVLKWEHFRHPRNFFTHTYDKVVPRTGFKQHPERFSIVKGKSAIHNLCPTHPENIEAFKRTVRKMMEQYPNKKYFSVSENDGNYGYCQCQRCLEIIRKHGNSPIAPHLYLVNEVAKFVADKAPKQLVEFNVYNRKLRKIVPSNLNIEPNVNIWFCCIGDKIIPENKKNGREEELRRWRDKINHMTVWDYSVDFSNYFRVVPSLYAKHQNLKLFKKYNCEGFMFQEACGVRAGDQQRLRAWVLAKLLWNPDLDADKLAHEYCYGVYGDAAPERYQYYELVEKAGRAGKSIEDFYGVPQFVSEASKLFETALAKVKNNSVVLRELEMDYLPILVTELDAIYKKYPANKKDFPQERYQYLLSEIKRISSQYKMNSFSEGTTMAGYIAEREMLQELSANNGIFEMYACNGKLYGYPTINDPLAEGGKVTKQKCDAIWSVQWPLPVNLFEPMRRYQLVVEMRVEKNSNLKEVCRVGIYNAASNRPNKHDFLESVAGNLLSNTEYKFINVGKPFLIKKGTPYLYFTVPTSSDIGALYVNRIRLIPVK